MKNCVILANGSFPASAEALEQLRNATALIACDGAVASLHERGLVPTAVVGDMDSIPADLRGLYADRLHGESEQETNDLSKAVRYACAAGYRSALILGATGLREDHTLGNISLLLDYALLLERVEMWTDYGRFLPVRHSGVFASVPGQQISIFSLSPDLKLNTEGLRWPICHRALTSWWQGTLIEALGSSFRLVLEGEGGLLLFFNFI
ncbi:MAG: thiamine diphosphokinase [Tannerella sp.]|jgi:thiamine pyrophosphokinase|nr:thiamine diphosphokinase [Tannerella sp.]